MIASHTAESGFHGRLCDASSSFSNANVGRHHATAYAAACSAIPTSDRRSRCASVAGSAGGFERRTITTMNANQAARTMHRPAIATRSRAIIGRAERRAKPLYKEGAQAINCPVIASATYRSNCAARWAAV